jgi:transposase
MLLRAYPAWQSVYTYFQQWRDDGSGPRIHDTLRAQVCQKAGRHQLVLRSQGQKGFVVLPRRWVVERTFAWLTQCRRLSKEYERFPVSSEAMIYLAMIRLMVRRLAAA